MILRVLVRLFVVALLAAILVAVRLHDDPEHVKPDHVGPPVAEVLPGSLPDVYGALETVRDQELERERQEAEQAAMEAARRAATPASGRPGAHSDAWWHAIARCEQGGRNDPYYGFFSIIDGSVGGQPWDVQVARANGIIAEYGDGAWAAACVAQAYAASPGG